MTYLHLTNQANAQREEFGFPLSAEIDPARGAAI